MNDLWDRQQGLQLPDTPYSGNHAFAPRLLTLPARREAGMDGNEQGTITRLSQFRPMHPPSVAPKPAPIQRELYYRGWVQDAVEVQSQAWNQPTMRFSSIPPSPRQDV